MSDAFAVILPAAGRSVRFGRDKLLTPLHGKPVITHAVAAFAGRRDVASILIPTNQREPIEGALAESGASARVRFCRGGASRAESVLCALREVPADIEWVAVHDAARPLVSQQLIDATFAAARRHGAAVPALAVSLTIKQASGPLPARVEQTVPRHGLWTMQTPQVMRRADLLAAYESCPLPMGEVTDDAQLLELAGCEVWLIGGDERNLKITTATDLLVAEMLLPHPPSPHYKGE